MKKKKLNLADLSFISIFQIYTEKYRGLDDDALFREVLGVSYNLEKNIGESYFWGLAILRIYLKKTFKKYIFLLFFSSTRNLPAVPRAKEQVKKKGNYLPASKDKKKTMKNGVVFFKTTLSKKFVCLS